MLGQGIISCSIGSAKRQKKINNRRVFVISDTRTNMKKDIYIGKHFSLHNTWRGKECFEFSPLPFISIDGWRVLIGWLFFIIQYSFKENDVDSYL